jgi:hypothetical protein
MIEQREGYLPKEQRKTILLLSDDLRLPSGIGTQSREFVLSTCHRYNYLQVGAAIKHPDTGKILDISKDVEQITGVVDAYVRVFPFEGYGNVMLIRDIMRLEKIDGLMIFTDPRFFTWLFDIEDEIREQMPIIYWNIWDDLPYPMWNRPYYASCDLLMGISKQTTNINREVLGPGNYIELDFMNNYELKK